MLKYPCLVLDHDDTVVQSETTVGYPCFCEFLDEFRPGTKISLEDYVRGCHDMVFTDMCRQYWGFTDEELKQEYLQWKSYVRTHIPAPFPGIRRLLHRYRQAGGLIFVSSLSGEENILRDYDVHFGLRPDGIYSCDLPEEKRKPSSYALLDIMERFQLRPQDILVVDDAKLVLKMAQPAGVQVAFAAWSKADFPDLTQEMQSLCDFTFHLPADLEAFLFDCDSL